MASAGDAWCARCARAVDPITITPPRAWLAGCLGFIGAIVLMIGALFVVLFVVLTARHATSSEAYDVAYGFTTAIGLVAPTIAAAIIGGILLHSQRRRVCPLCRTASLTWAERPR